MGIFDFKSPRSRYEEKEQIWEDMSFLLRTEGRFLRVVEFSRLGGLALHTALQAVDRNYRLGRLAKQLSIDDRSAVFTAQEAPIPEIGFSPVITKKLSEAQIYPDEYANLIGSYGLNDPEFINDPLKRIVEPASTRPWVKPLHLS